MTGTRVGVGGTEVGLGSIVGGMLEVGVVAGAHSARTSAASIIQSKLFILVSCKSARLYPVRKALALQSEGLFEAYFFKSITL